MAANEFEKNVQREMDEFKLHPSDEVWIKIDARIRENKRKRRVLFFILFSSIALMLGGYGIYNLPSNNIRPESQNKLSEGSGPNDENKTGNSKDDGHNKQTITIKPNIPVENNKPTNKTLAVSNQKQISGSFKENKHVTSILKGNSVSQKGNLATVKTNQEGQQNITTSEGTIKENSDNSFLNQQLITDNNQNETIKTENKNLTLSDTTGSKLERPTDIRSVQVMGKTKGDKVSNKITWGINFSAGRSVITEDAFSFKSSYAVADMQYSAPGSSQGGTPSTGGGGSGGSAYYRYSQSQNEPAFAFKAGINARKNISKRSSVSAGLGYSYLADKIKIGTNQASSQSSMALSYYSGSPQKTHTDQFHFLELPLIYTWRVTNNADHFLSLHAGAAPSYLLKTNALVYDTAMGGIYYYNKNFVTKTHFNFISGISYQFNNKKNLEFSIGPQFTFDVTKVFKSDLDKRKYFLYTGIDARVFFEKKKK